MKINKTAYFGLILLALITAGCLDNGNNHVTTSPAISPSPGWSLTTIPNASLSSVTYGAGKFVAVGSRIAYSDDGQVWLFATGPSPSNYDRLYDVTFGNGVFVAVGYKWDSSLHGVVFVSSDALEWVDVTPAPNPGSFAGQSNFPNQPLQLNSVTYANGQFLAVGNLGTTLVSNDGRTWRDVTVSSADPGNPYHTANTAAIDSYAFSSIAYLNGMFIATGYWVCPSMCHGLGLAPYGARLFSSTDGNTWSFIPQSSLANPQLSYPTGALASDGNQLVAAGYDKTLGNTLLVSTDGQTWQLPASLSDKARSSLTSSSSSATVQRITYGNGKFIAVGVEGLVLISANGTDWVSADDGPTGKLSSASFAGSTYGNGKFVVVGDGAVLTSK